MPDQVRFVQRKDDTFDAYIRELVSSRGYGKELAYAGIADAKRAAEVRQKLRTAGRHLEVSVKAYWKPCPTPGRCKAGSDCRFHVFYSAFQRDAARAYKARVAKRAS